MAYKLLINMILSQEQVVFVFKLSRNLIIFSSVGIPEVAIVKSSRYVP